MQKQAKEQERCHDCGGNHPPVRVRCQRHSGWTNYETWAVKLWIDNERADYEYWRERTATIIAENIPARYEWETAEQRRIVHLADELADTFTDGLLETGLHADLLGAAFDSVNWREIAEAMIEEAKEG